MMFNRIGLGFGLPIRVVENVSTIENAIYTMLTGDVTTAAIVTDRVFPNILPQGQLMPCLTFQQISGPRDLTANGPSGLVFARYQINAWARTYKSAKELAMAVRLVMNGFSGTIDSVQIQLIKLSGEGDIPVMPAGTDVLMRFGKRLDFTICFGESV